MKRVMILAAAALCMAGTASAQQAIEGSKLTDNISIGVKSGVTTHIPHGPFFKQMRNVSAVEIRKGITPVFGLGVEGQASVNTSSWYGPKSANVFDHSYVGLFGTVNLNNLFAGYTGTPRPFEVEVQAGAGWLHSYFPKNTSKDYNTVGAKAGLNFNWNIGEAKAWTISLSPSVLWNERGHGSAYYGSHRAEFQLMAGVAYHFKNSNGTHSFVVARPYNQAEIDALNDQVNKLRAENQGLQAALQTSESTANIIAGKLRECENRPVQVVKETNTDYQSIRYVFYKIGSSKIAADQQPNVIMIADYLKHNPKATVVIKGYASADGNAAFNEKLAAARAESVKNELIKRFKIAPNRIKAEGQGIGHMFKEESWNRVSICVLDE